MSDAQPLAPRVAELERQLAQLRGELTTASTTASMAAHGLDALEDELARLAAAAHPPTPPAAPTGAAGATANPAGAAPAGGTSQQRQPLSLDELRTWVATVLLPTREPLVKTGRAQPTGVRWCPQWYEHPEAVSRLRAMAEAHRAMQAEIADNGPGWIEATYWRDVADPLWRELTSDAGPFHACSPGSHAHPTALAEHGTG